MSNETSTDTQIATPWNPSNVVSEIFLSITISLFIILKIIELILKQVNQHKNFNQQTEKINLMNVNAATLRSSTSEEEMTKKIYKVVQALKTT